MGGAPDRSLGRPQGYQMAALVGETTELRAIPATYVTWRMEIKAYRSGRWESWLKTLVQPRPWLKRCRGRCPQVGLPRPTGLVDSVPRRRDADRRVIGMTAARRSPLSARPSMPRLRDQNRRAVRNSLGCYLLSLPPKLERCSSRIEPQGECDRCRRAFLLGD
jgi:hypothetical protein